jgi:GNAT superfamily N-acetyltransferase
MAEIRSLRAICWEPVYSRGGTLEDGFDHLAQHWTLEVGAKLVAAARLTIHENLTEVPDAHLFTGLPDIAVAFPLGYITRLVVHPDYRTRGVAMQMDRERITAAKSAGCRSIAAVWNTLSGERRRNRLRSIGFRSFDHDALRDDGAFGRSSVYFLSLDGASQ